MFCLRCGNQIENDAAFCSKCGSKVSEITPSTPAVSSGNALPNIEKAPEYGQRVMSTTNLDPHYKTVAAAIKIIRWVICIGLIYILLGEYSVIVLIIVIIICVKLSKAAANFILHAYEMIKGAKLISVEYSSYINTKNADLIVPVLISPMLAHNIRIGVGSETNSIDIVYCDRKYAVTFSTEPGSNLKILGDDDFNENSYANMCNDVPVIAFYIQDTLRNL
ncbi:MAG: zinc ribbon domain-containing protein [Ruminococcus sp.]|nr:zinc ribbon domain-containing protein [Ruminococcus sp.]